MNWAKTIFIILLASAAMLLPAFFNGFPLVYSDSGAYIASGFEGKVPGDRPIFYGLFIRHASLAHSLWLVIVAQAIILSSLLYYITRKILGNSSSHVIYFVSIILGLNLLSSLPWFSSMLMADVFTSISFLLLFVLLFIKPQNWWAVTFISLLYLLAAGMHLTHLPAHMALLVGLIFFKLIKLKLLKDLSWLRLAAITLLVSANLVIIPAVHYAHKGGYAASKNGYMFLTARLIESGAVKAYLDDECSLTPNFLCAYKDSLPKNGSDFLWLPESILYKLGGWGSYSDEFKSLNKAIFTTPKYLKIYVSHFYKVLTFHLGAHKIGEELIPLGQNSPPGWETEAHFKEELPQLIASKQAQNYWRGKLSGLNQLIFWVLIGSIIFCIYFLVIWQTNVLLTLLIISLFLIYIGNFFAVCIASSGSRYNARLDWLFVLAAMMAMIVHFRKNPESRI